MSLFFFLEHPSCSDRSSGVQSSVLLCIFSSPAILSLKRSRCQCFSLLCCWSCDPVWCKMTGCLRLCKKARPYSALCRDTVCSQAEPLVMNAEMIPRATSAALACSFKQEVLCYCQTLHFEGVQKWRKLSLASDAHCVKICCLLGVQNESFQSYMILSKK